MQEPNLPETKSLPETETVDCESSGDEDQLWNRMETIKDTRNTIKKREFYKLSMLCTAIKATTVTIIALYDLVTEPSCKS